MIRLGNNMKLSLEKDQMNFHIHERMVNEIIRDAMADDVIRDVEIIDGGLKLRVFIEKVNLEVFVTLGHVALDIVYPNLSGAMHIEKVQTVDGNKFVDFALKGTKLIQIVMELFASSWQVNGVNILFEKELIKFESDKIKSEDVEKLLLDNKYTSTIKLEECVKVKLDTIVSGEVVIALYDDSHAPFSRDGSETVERGVALK